jgi:hypothetical protein
VTSLNKSLDFNEGGSEIQATLKVGSYSVTEYAAEIQRAIRAVGTQNYLVIFNRTTRKLTISAPLSFALLAGTGSRIGTGVLSLAGFTATNKTGTNNYTAENVTGFVYTPQYYLHNYIQDSHSIVLEDGTADSTPLGIAQVAKFGDGARIPLKIIAITNKLGLKNIGFIEDASGIDNFMTFIRYCMNKGRVEFIPDVDLPNNFTKCFLESTPEDKEARKFNLKNMNTPDFYESGVLTFRKVLT